MSGVRTLQLAPVSLLLMVSQLHRLPSPPLLQAVTLACSLMPDPVCQLLYCALLCFQGTVLQVKMFCLFLCIVCVKSIVSLLQYNIADYVSWVPGLTLLNLGKIRLKNTLSEQNFICMLGTYFSLCTDMFLFLLDGLKF